MVTGSDTQIRATISAVLGLFAIVLGLLALATLGCGLAGVAAPGWPVALGALCFGCTLTGTAARLLPRH